MLSTPSQCWNKYKQLSLSVSSRDLLQKAALGTNSRLKKKKSANQKLRDWIEPGLSLSQSKPDKMMRSVLLRGVAPIRRYSTAPPAANPAASSIDEQLNRLLARVDALKMNDVKHPKSARAGSPQRKNRTPKGKQSSEKPREARSNQKSAAPKPQRSKFASTNELGDLYADASSSFNTTLDSTKKFVRPVNDKPRTRFAQRARSQSQSQRSNPSLSGKSNNNNNKKKSSNQRRSTPITNKSTNSVNPNLANIHTQYIPEELTVESLLSESSITSQTIPSRVIKAYQRLAIDSEADVSGILTGKFETTPSSSILSKLNTPALKLNGQTVVNSLNSNGSIDQETKAKLLGPLVGLAPVRELNA